MSTDSSHKKATEFLVDHRRALVVVVIGLTVLMGVAIPRLQMDPTLRAFRVSSSAEYVQYEDMLKTFGNDEFLLIAIKNEIAADDPRMFRRIEALTQSLESMDEVSEVISLSNVQVFEQRGGLFGTYPAVGRDRGSPVFPEAHRLKAFRKGFPHMAFLVSDDLKTVGLVVRLCDEWRFDPRMGELLDRIDRTIQVGIPAESEFRMVGPDVLRQSFLRSNRRTAILFGFMGFLISALASIYVFRSLRLTIMSLFVVSVCLTWLLGIMSYLDIWINTATSLSFGIILIVGAATMVHIITHFDKAYHQVGEPVKALKVALDKVLGPCVMCTLTTSAGFASIMVSDIPMVRQVGMNLSLGALSSGLVAIVLTTGALVWMKPVDAAAYRKMTHDAISTIMGKIKSVTFRHYQISCAAGILIATVMLLGIPNITVRTEPLQMFRETSPEFEGIEFVQEHLAPTRVLEVVVDLPNNSFRTGAAWRMISEFESGIREIEEVEDTVSMLALLHYVHREIMGPEANANDLFSKPGLAGQLLHTASFTRRGKRRLARRLDDRFSRTRISVQMRHPASRPISDTIGRIKALADRSEVSNAGRVVVTGRLAVYAAHLDSIVKAQAQTLILALSCISLLMTVQFRSVTLGLLSLIPNFLPVAVVFGVMGWFGLPLDSMTVFAAAVSIGLSVDDTIHFLTQFRREARGGNGLLTIRECLERAYDVTGRALISTSAILAFGFLTLVLSPFTPVAAFGVLLCSGMISALIGDLVFMPAVILSASPVRSMLSKSLGITERRQV